MSDHRVLGNRSRAYLSMEQLDSALDDAVECCRIRPFWAKVYSDMYNIHRYNTVQYIGTVTEMTRRRKRRVGETGQHPVYDCVA